MLGGVDGTDQPDFLGPRQHHTEMGQVVDAAGSIEGGERGRRAG